MDYYYLIRYFISPSVSLAIWEYKFQVPSSKLYKYQNNMGASYDCESCEPTDDGEPCESTCESQLLKTNCFKMGA